MGESEKKKYLQILKDGTETRYVIKIFILGKNGVGKTSLMRHLLGERLDGVTSTEGIDIVKRCKIRVRDGHWEPCEGIISNKYVTSIHIYFLQFALLSIKRNGRYKWAFGIHISNETAML